MGMDEAKFRKLVLARRESGLCNCWDHLRADGLTPPLSLRASHPQRYPHQVFGVDLGGEPQPKANNPDEEQGPKEQHQKTTPTERSHLREAVANRSVM